VSTTTIEHPSSPQIELFHGLQLSPVEIAALTASNASVDPEKSFREALLAYRVFAMRQLRKELIAQQVLNEPVIRSTLDSIWVQFSPVFRRATGPMIAEAYLRAFIQVETGNVPAQLVYALADQHAERVGKYFNETSADALVQGFQTYVNRQVPQRAAIERVIDAYGLTPRQMSGYTSAAALNPLKMETSYPQNLKRKVLEYIGKSISQRLNVFQRQEAHNLDEQAKQVAWLWLVENHRLPETATKMWLTANDEKVCPQCGPMHRQKVKVAEKFKLPNGNELFTPGAHVNCRCQVRLQVNPFEEVQKADWDPKEHPRGGNPTNRGQFSRYRDQPEVKERERSEVLEEMLRGVRERQAREVEPVIETPPAYVKPTLGAPRAKPTLGAPITRPEVAPPTPQAPVVKPTLGAPPVREKAPAPVAKPTLGAPKPTISGPPEPITNKPTIGAPKITFDTDYARYERKVDERINAQQTTATELAIARPTRAILGEDRKPTTGVTVASSGDLVDGQATALLTDDNFIFVGEDEQMSQEWVDREVVDQYDQIVTEKYNEIRDQMTYDYDEDTEEYTYDLPGSIMGGEDDEENIDVWARITGDELWDVVQGALYGKQEYGARYKQVNQSGFRLQWMDEDGTLQREDDYTLLEVADMLGIEPDEYRPVLMKIDEGYDSAHRRGVNTWRAPGEYTVANQTYKTIQTSGGRSVTYMEVTLHPQVTEELIYRPKEPPQDLPHDRQSPW